MATENKSQKQHTQGNTNFFVLCHRCQSRTWQNYYSKTSIAKTLKKNINHQHVATKNGPKPEPLFCHCFSTLARKRDRTRLKALILKGLQPKCFTRWNSGVQKTLSGRWMTQFLYGHVVYLDPVLTYFLGYSLWLHSKGEVCTFQTSEWWDRDKCRLSPQKSTHSKHSLIPMSNYPSISWDRPWKLQYCYINCKLWVINQWPPGSHCRRKV